MTGTDAIVIQARSRRQAMDWSLVLLSQGVECVIDRREDDWSLWVESADQERAAAAIRQYELENRAWPWSQRLSWPKAGFDFAVVFWCLAMAAFHWMSALHPELKRAGMLDSIAVENGAWWLIFTATTLHADLAHLMTNLTAGFAILGLAMARYGPGCALFAAFLAGAAGNVAGVLLRSEPYLGLGSSGLVMGGLGLITVQSLALWHANPGRKVWRYILCGLFAGVMLFMLWGLAPDSDVIAHAGGFVSGLLFGTVLALLPQRLLFMVRINAATTIGLVALAAAAWVLSWRHATPPL